MRDINEVAKKMARNGLKIAKSLGCAFHFESEFSFWTKMGKVCHSGPPRIAPFCRREPF